MSLDHRAILYWVLLKLDREIAEKEERVTRLQNRYRNPADDQDAKVAYLTLSTVLGELEFARLMFEGIHDYMRKERTKGSACQGS